MDSHDQLESAQQQQPTKFRGWQYSLFGLLVVMTIASVCFAFGANFPGLALTILAVGVLQVAFMYAIDWSMRSKRGRSMHKLTASLWIIVGTVLVLVAIAIGQLDGGGVAALVLALVFAGFGAVCWLVAWNRWQHSRRSD